jgi:hypothetical protein
MLRTPSTISSSFDRRGPRSGFCALGLALAPAIGPSGRKPPARSAWRPANYLDVLHTFHAVVVSACDGAIVMVIALEGG